MEIVIDAVGAIVAALIVALSTLYIFLLQPAAKEDANRRALHQLEVFCPPNWSSKSVKKINRALSRLYKELQYASRGHSFIITRAAAWEMKKLLKNKTEPNEKLSEAESQNLYIWKTLIAILLSKKNLFPNIIWSQRKFKTTLHRAIAHTKWILFAYDHMNNTSLKNFFPLLEEFEEKLLQFQRNEGYSTTSFFQYPLGQTADLNSLFFK